MAMQYSSCSDHPPLWVGTHWHLSKVSGGDKVSCGESMVERALVIMRDKWTVNANMLVTNRKV